MMEVWSIIALCFASTVTATPYGYGVKGGASAKAEASAAAYAGLPAIPLSIPSGPGISGSFSKSSSSSFASSSASSSSSSSSFSFNGAGANDFRINGGCSGGCPNKGGNGATSLGNDATSLSNGAFESNYKSDGSNAGSSAGVGQGISNVPSYSKNKYQPCDGANCNEYGNNMKCSSGQCLTGSLSENGDNSDEENDSHDVECTSPNCKQGSSELTDNENESNDIKINVAGNSKYSGAKLSNLEGSSHDNKYANGCNNGNCNPAAPQTFQPSNTYGNNNIRTPTPSSGVSVTPKCLTPNCDSNYPTSPSQGTTAPGYDKPSQHLSTPNYGPICTTFPCNSQPSSIDFNNEKLPTSYNSPISTVQGPSSIPQNKNTPCLSGPCLNSNLPNLPSGAPAFGAPIDSSLPVTCSTGSCNLVPDTSVHTGHVTYPPYGTTSNSHETNSGHYQTQPSGSSLCQGPNCNKPNYGINANQPSQNNPSNCGIGTGCGHNPDSVSGLGGKPGYQLDLPKLGHVAPNIQPTYSGIKTPPQNFGTQPGFPGVTEGSKIHNVDENSSHYAFNPNSPSISEPNTGLVPPYPANSGSYGNTNFPSTNTRPGIYSKPNTGIPHSDENVPAYTGAFGVPPNSYTGFEKPINGNGVRNPNSPGSYSPQSGVPFDTSKPNIGIPHSNENVPGYTGLIGAPANSYSGFSKPINENGVRNPNSPGSYSLHSGVPFDSSKLKTGIPHSNENGPAYPGGFGAPANSYSGFSKPLNDNGVRNPNSPGSYSPQSGVPNFASYSPSSAVQPKPGYPGPSSQYQPTHGSILPGSVSPFSPANTKPSVTNVPKPFVEKEKTPYTGGFGGPAGLLKPNEYTLPDKIPTSPAVHKSDSCLSGDCSPKTYKTSEGGSSAFSNGAATASATASAHAKATAYTGGFGGPPGYLKPNDNEKPLKFVPLNGKGSQGIGGTSQYGHSAANSGNDNHDHSSNEGDGTSAHNNANAVAQASAVASAQAGASSNSNQDDNKGCSLCTGHNTANGANGNYGSSSGLSNAGIGGDYGSSNNAGALAAAKSVANAGAGSYGHGGSFASSSASAHASAGVPTKGGYGRR